MERDHDEPPSIDYDSFEVPEVDAYSTPLPSMNDLSQFVMSDVHNETELDLQLGGSKGKKSSSACVALASVSIVLNLFVMATLFRHKHRAFKNVFYLLVLHCSFVDLIRAVSLIVWFLPELDLFEIEEDTFLLFMKVKQVLVIEMRSLNMLTILNLLLFTINEFIVVKRPLQYQRIARRRAIVLLLIINWVACFVFGLASVLTRNYSSPSPMVHRNTNLETPFIANQTHDHITLRRRGDQEESIQNIFIFSVIIMCALCMVVIFTCYAQIMMRVRQFHKFDSLATLQAAENEGLRFRGSISSCSVETKQRRLQILIRHKYLLVIGLVLLMDVLFLIPYSLIQIFQYVHLSRSSAISYGKGSTSYNSWLHSRWISQLLIALHTVLQPLCYFRMEEFRRLAFCKREGMSQGGEWGPRMANRSGESYGQLAAMTEDDEEILVLSAANNAEGFPLTELRSMI